MAPKYDDSDNILDIGKSLKQEKTLKQNLDKIAEVKNRHSEKQKEDLQKNTKLFPFFTKHKIAFFLLIMILLATGIRFYVASMPITADWAEQVVADDLKNQVTNIINQENPTLSDEKKQELINDKTLEVFNSQQNQQALKNLREQYINSYKDPDGNIYLYEIDPYFFYDLAQTETSLDIYDRNTLPSIEFYSYKLLKTFLPGITFAGSIFYLPLIFTILCAIVLFFITKEIWNSTAGFFAGVFFVSQPLLLEFSLLGFVDTNMLNMFLILVTGLLFIYVVKQWKKDKLNYFLISLFLVLLILFIVIFRNTWSAWYISVALILTPITFLLCLFFVKKIWLWKEQTRNVKTIIIIFLLLFISISSVFLYYGLQDSVDKNIDENRLLAAIPTSIKKYLHMDYDDPYGEWPDAFSLIKELQLTNLDSLIKYTGGALYALLSLFCLLYLTYKKWNQPKLKYIYLIIGYFVFFILATRAIRLLPYFIPYFAITIGISMSVIIAFCFKKICSLIAKEKRIMQIIIILLFFATILLVFSYSLVPQIIEKSDIMPIMDDSIYNSAVYIKENSNSDAIINTWWDRGTFYKALAEREVHLHSQPHMPRTYWLASLYMTDNDSKAKNTISMLNCDAEFDIFQIFKINLTKSESINSMHSFLSSYNKEELLDNETKVLGELYSRITNLISCDKLAEETYVILIDDMMPRFSSVQYFSEWYFELNQPDPKYQYSDLVDAGCLRTQSGAYCDFSYAQYFINFTSMQVQTNSVHPEEVFIVNNGEVTRHVNEDVSTGMTLIVYQRDKYWKALLIPKETADSFYVRLMLLDGYGFDSFEKVFEEVHTETSWVKVYKVNWER